MVVAAGLLRAPAATASDFYVVIRGSKQDYFHGEGTGSPLPNQIPGLKYDYKVTNVQSSTGQGSGKRQHTPITFQKQWGPATVQLYRALVTNEVLTKVTFYFYDTNSDGQFLQFKVTLTNAAIVGIHQHVGDTNPDGTLNSQRLEDITISYQTITIEDNFAFANDVASAAGQAPKPTRLAGSTQPRLKAAKPTLIASAARH